MSPFEIAMLVLFGIGWPFSIAKAVTTKKVEGKSPVFMAMAGLGYLFGILHKISFSFDWITGLYVLNFAMIVADLRRYFRYLPRGRYSSRGSARRGGG